MMWAQSARFHELVRGSHTAPRKLEVWRGSDHLDDVEVDGDTVLAGEVSDTRASGIRGQISVTVPATRQWKWWLTQPMLELRAFQGVQVRRGQVEWCPLGRFHILPPQATPRQTASITLQGLDLWSWVVQRSLVKPQPSYPGWIDEVCAALIDECALGVRAESRVSIRATMPPPTMWLGSRHKIITNLLPAIVAEAYVDRLGHPIIADRRTTGEPSSLAGPDTLLSEPQITTDWSKVFNAVTIVPQAQDSPVQPVTVAVTWPGHPAYAGRIGPRVMDPITAPVENDGQALAMANAELDKVSLLARTLAFDTVPDPTRQAGDFIGVDPGGAYEIAQIQTITHPLLADGVQKITTVSTRQDETT